MTIETTKKNESQVGLCGSDEMYCDLCDCEIPPETDKGDTGLYLCGDCERQESGVDREYAQSRRDGYTAYMRR